MVKFPDLIMMPSFTRRALQVANLWIFGCEGYAALDEKGNGRDIGIVVRKLLHEYPEWILDYLVATKGSYFGRSVIGKSVVERRCDDDAER